MVVSITYAHKLAVNLEFEKAAELRDIITDIKTKL